MPYRINHIHLKAPDPRKTAEWYVTAFGFKIVNDETRVFGDRFVRCQTLSNCARLYTVRTLSSLLDAGSLAITSPSFVNPTTTMICPEEP